MLRRTASVFEVRNRLFRFVENATTSRDFFGAILTGYALTALSLGVQFVLTPVYLNRLGQSQFGKLMMVLSFVNFIAIGITWMSGGLTRILGELWSVEDHDGFRMAYALGKWVFCVYAVLVSVVGLGIWAILEAGAEAGSGVPLWAVGAALYLIASYESNPDRQAFVAMCKQAQGNVIEAVRVAVFAVLTLLLLPVYPQIELVLLAYLVGILVQRGLMVLQLRKSLSGLRWRLPDKGSRNLLRRLAGKQGLQYVAYGALLLAMQADLLILGFLAGPDIAAKYAVLWKIPEALSLVLWRIPSAIEPHVVRMDASNNRRGLVRMFNLGRIYFLGLVLFVAIGFAVAGQALATLWVGGFAPEEPWMYWLAATAMFLLTIARWPISVAYALIKLKPLIIIGVIELIAKIALTAILLPQLSYAAPLAAIVIVHVAVIAWAYQFFINAESLQAGAGAGMPDRTGG